MHSQPRRKTKPKKRRVQGLRVVSVLAFPILLGMAAVATVSETIQEPEPTQVPFPSRTPVPAPSITPTYLPTYTPTATITPTPSATPTPDLVVEVTAGMKVDRSLRYLDMILVIEERTGYTPDPLLVVAVIAMESGGDQTIESYAASCGIMQVEPKPWYGISAERICGSAWSNAVMGVWILQEAIENAGGDVRLGLALYNCSEQNVAKDACGSEGGLNYADTVLNFWLPRVQARLEEGD